MQKLLIGYGNPLRCDDGLGWFLADEFQAAHPTDDVHIIVAHQLTPEMAEAVSQAAAVLFIDAEIGSEPGCWSITPVSVELGEGLSALVHHLSPGQLLALAQTLYGFAPPGEILTVVGADFGYGEELSQTILDVLPDVRRTIHAFLQS